LRFGESGRSFFNHSLECCGLPFSCWACIVFEHQSLATLHFGKSYLVRIYLPFESMRSIISGSRACIVFEHQSLATLHFGKSYIVRIYLPFESMRSIISGFCVSSVGVLRLSGGLSGELIWGLLGGWWGLLSWWVLCCLSHCGFRVVFRV
jgi:hypothetical protein